MMLTVKDGRPSCLRTYSVIQRSPAPTIRRTLKRFRFGCAVREDCMLRRPRMRSPDCGYSSTASLSVDVVLRLEIVHIGGSPMAIQRRANFSVVHVKSP